MGFFGKLFNNGSRRGKTTEEERLCSRIENIMATTYSRYELKKNVPATVMGADDSAKEYSYGIYYNDRPKLFITIIVDRNDYRLKCYRLAKEAAQNNGVEHFNFFCHLPNEESYIVNRLAEVLER